MPGPVVRFAPSPTGLIHIGNARTALLNWLYARRHGGRFVLRYDDTDRERSREAFAAAIAEDLAWLGIVPDLVVRQSDRTGLYEAAAERLKAVGRLYPAYETADELDRRRKRQLARGLPPVYDRAALALSAEERARLEAEGRRPHWRFRLDGRVVGWDDLVKGPQAVDTRSLSDPVLIREDGSFLYTFTSVVDDADLGMTHVVRGEDHVTNSAVQVEIWEALGVAVPAMGHHNLLATTTGEALSKRLGSMSIASLREAGYLPMAVASLAVLTGTAEEVHAYASLDELAPHAGLDRISASTAKFDPHELDQLNARLLHAVPFAAVAEALAARGVGGGAAFHEAVRDNAVTLADHARWWAIATGGIEPVAEAADEAFLAEAARLLPDEPFDRETWGRWTEALKAATGRKGKALFLPLRRALTGLDHGPALDRLLPFIGRRNSSVRLSGPFARPEPPSGSTASAPGPA